MKSLLKNSRIMVFFLSLYFFWLITGCVTLPSPARPAWNHMTGLIAIETRPGVKQSFAVIKPENPVASVLCLRGGKGLFELQSFSGEINVGQGRKLFEMIVKEFAARGIAVAVADAPSDKSKGLDPFFRNSKEHAKDIEAMVFYLVEEIKLPVWLFGHSFGTLSAVNGVIHTQAGIAGLILASPSTRMIKDWGEVFDSNPNGIIDMDLEKIQVPSLLIYHQHDKCVGAPPSNIEKLTENIKYSRAVGLTGGKTQKSKPCGPTAAHSFFGIEKQFF